MSLVQPKAPRSKEAVLASETTRVYSKQMNQKIQIMSPQRLSIDLTIWTRIVQHVLQFIMHQGRSAVPTPKMLNHLASPMETTWFSATEAWSSSSHSGHRPPHQVTLHNLVSNKDQKFTLRDATPRKRYKWISRLSLSRTPTNRTSLRSRPTTTTSSRSWCTTSSFRSCCRASWPCLRLRANTSSVNNRALCNRNCRPNTLNHRHATQATFTNRSQCPLTITSSSSCSGRQMQHRIASMGPPSSPLASRIPQKSCNKIWRHLAFIRMSPRRTHKLLILSYMLKIISRLFKISNLTKEANCAPKANNFLATRIRLQRSSKWARF